MKRDRNDAFAMGRRWLIFSSVLLLGVLASICMFKAPPLFATEFSTDLGFTDASIGWVMSMFALIGVVLAFPASGILAKLGTKKSLIVTAVSFILGSVLGAVANNAAIMLASRFIEGVGMGLVSVVGGAAVATVIPRAKQGLAMGLWSTWFPAGVVIAFNVSPFLYSAVGTWRAAWWFTAVLAVIALVFAALVYADPPQEREQECADAGIAASLKPNMFGLVMVAIAFGAWNTVNGGAVSSFYPTFLAEVHGLDTQAAGAVSSVTNLCMLVLGPLMGALADKFSLQKVLSACGLFLGAILFAFGFSDNMTFVWVFVVLMAFASSACATGTFSAVPLYAKNPQKVGLGMAFAAFFQNIGILAGSAAFAPIASSMGWAGAAMAFCIPICVAGAACGLAALASDKKKRV